MRPKYKTRSGRVVWGGGITPDQYIAWDQKLQKTLNDCLPIRNVHFSIGVLIMPAVTERNLILMKIIEQIGFWTKAIFRCSWITLKLEDIELKLDELEQDKDYILNMLKSEIASAHWGKMKPLVFVYTMIIKL